MAKRRIAYIIIPYIPVGAFSFLATMVLKQIRSPRDTSELINNTKLRTATRARARERGGERGEHSFVPRSVVQGNGRRFCRDSEWHWLSALYTPPCIPPSSLLRRSCICTHPRAPPPRISGPTSQAHAQSRWGARILPGVKHGLVEDAALPGAPPSSEQVRPLRHKKSKTAATRTTRGAFQPEEIVVRTSVEKGSHVRML